jgi:hypothetical protein
MPYLQQWSIQHSFLKVVMEQHALIIVNNCLNTNICSYLETSVGQSYNLYLNVAYLFQHQC